jgi:hypothetical protein
MDKLETVHWLLIVAFVAVAAYAFGHSNADWCGKPPPADQTERLFWSHACRG